MRITEILSAELVIPELQADTKAGVLREMASRFSAQVAGTSADALAHVLSEREHMGSTAIGDGIAIPHGKLKAINRIAGLFARSAKGVDFDSLDGKPTCLFFLLVAPEESSSLHLKALARVSRLFKDPAFRERLMKAHGSDEIYKLIVDEDNRY